MKLYLASTKSSANTEDTGTDAAVAGSARGSRAEIDRLEVISSRLGKRALETLEVEIFVRDSLRLGQRVLQFRVLVLPFGRAKALDKLANRVGKAVDAVAQLDIEVSK